MNYGYVRVRQNAINRDECIQKQTELLQADGVEKTIVETDGSQLGGLLATLKPNDALHVVSIDRLTRSLSKMEELADYFKDNNITLYEGNRPVDLKMQLLMFQIAQLPTHYEDEYEEDEYEEDEYEYEDDSYQYTKGLPKKDFLRLIDECISGEKIFTEDILHILGVYGDTYRREKNTIVWEKSENE